MKFDIAITTVVRMQRSSNPVTSSLASPSQKRQEKGKACRSVPETERQEVVDCGTKRARKVDTSETAKCVT